jgi:Xaa-Pro aminopeptidase
MSGDASRRSRLERDPVRAERLGLARDGAIPFDAERLERLLAERRIDVLLASSHYNLQHLLGGYRRFFFAVDDALGLSRSAPVLGYPAGRPDAAFYIGHILESSQLEFEPLWVGDVELSAWSAPAAMRSAAERIRALGLAGATIGVEPAFLALESHRALEAELPDARIVDAGETLEDLRAIKLPYELEIMRAASERVVDSMVATFARAAPGMATAEVGEILRAEEEARGLDYVYSQVMTGPEGYRYPGRPRRWEEGAALALDSGGALHGYLGDLTRMAIIGEPTAQQRELLAEVDSIQLAARGVIRAGAIGREIHEAVAPLISASAYAGMIDFIGEGAGLVGHEAPRLMTISPLPEPGRHNDEPLAAGMVLAIETTLKHPQVGVVKLEDVVAVTQSGCEALADRARGWTLAGC